MKVKTLFLFFLSLICFLVWFIFQVWPDSNLHVIFCDVGQGDATLITRGFTQMLVDAGPDEHVLKCLEEHLPFWDHTLEIIVATHPDADHIKGFLSVLDSYQVGQIFLEGRVNSTQTYANFRQKIKLAGQQGAHTVFPHSGQTYLFDPFVSLLILYPFQEQGKKEIFTSDVTLDKLQTIFKQQKNEYGDTNNGSVSVFLKFGTTTLLLTGDMDESIEQLLVEKGNLQKATIFKAGHHGSKTSNSWNFLQKIQPETIVISSGKGNRYGHPHEHTLQLFQQIGARVFRTDELGTVEFISNGKQYWQKKQFSFF